MTDRRTFLQAMGAAGLAASLPGAFGLGAARSDRLGAIGVQLYTVRDLMQQDFEGTLARVAQIGYRQVEFAGYFGRTPEQVRAVLDQNGLTAPSAHLPIETLDQGWDAALDAAKTIGHRYLVVAWVPQERRPTLAAWRQVGALFNRAGATAAEAGIGFAFHNHDYEFVPMEGKLPYDVLLDATDPAKVSMEMDLYWITKGGGDPLAYFARYPGRFPMVHVKDMAADQSMVDVGAGTIDWAKIFRHHRQAGIEYYFVEHDQPKDPFASITASYRYLRHLDF